MYCLQETHFKSKNIDKQCEGTETDIPCKWKCKENGCNYTYIRQNRF